MAERFSASGGALILIGAIAMSKRATDITFQLIKSLEKAEKRSFKLFIKRNSSNENLKIIQLFDVLDKLEDYDEARVLKKLPSVQKAQLSNLKSHLYRQILASLRLLKSSESLDLQLNEWFDYAHILYKKGLFLHSLKILERAKDLARANHKTTFLVQIIALEKRIESLHITRSMKDRADLLSQEAIEVSTHISLVARLSNLALQMYSWYIRYGHASNEAAAAAVKQFWESQLPPGALQETGFYERLYLYQSYSWYAYIRQDFRQYYRYTQKWVSLFDQHPLMQRVETGHYIKGMHNLINAHFDLRNHPRFLEALARLEAFAQTPRVQENENFRVQSFLYITQAKLNHLFLTGRFREGLKLVPSIRQKLKAYELFIDPHRLMVLNYKFATVYFGSGDYKTCIDYLQTIIQENSGLRNDLQCYARLMHLFAHFELGNLELVEYLSQSTYRFMVKMQNLNRLEEEIVRFLRRSFRVQNSGMKPHLQAFYERIRKYENDPLQARVFVYLDIVSWVESKVHRQPFESIVQHKYRQSKRSV